MGITYFLGSSGANGFRSRFDQLLPEHRLVRILKGGPGSGKSTLMKKLASAAEARGLAVERVLCTSDPGSLDAVSIPALSYALTDGTAPHVLEPTVCGCRAAYLDLGRGCDLSAAAPLASTLEALQEACGSCRRPADAALRALAALDPLLYPGAEEPPLLERFELPQREGMGRARTVFLSGFTPQGIYLHSGTVRTLCRQVILLETGREEASRALQKAEARIRAAGWDVLIGESPLLPGLSEALLVPGLGLGILRRDPLAVWELPGAETVPAGAPDREILDASRALLSRITASLREAKQLHDLLERTLASVTDFSVADEAASLCLRELSALNGEA